MTDVVVRAKNTFAVKDGQVLPIDSNNRDSNGNLFTLDTWMSALSKSDKAIHLFKPSQGSGAFRSKTTKQGAEHRTSVDRISSGLNAT